MAIYPIQLDVFVKDPSRRADPRVARRDAALRRLARESGGAFHQAMSAGELPRILTALGDDLRVQYRVSYQSSVAEPTDSFRRVEVRVPNRRGVRIRAPLGYYAD